MSGELEAAGAMATAGLAAGAIECGEPGAAGQGACLNCGAALAGRYCSACGQTAHSHRTLSHLLEEVLHGLFHFDTKAWRTLPMLASRPGTLTRSYIYGQRARYISPLALFLFTIFLMFFVFAFVEGPITLDQHAPASRAEAAAALSQARAALTETEGELAKAEAGPGDRYTPGLQLRLARQSVALMRAEVGRREQALARTDTTPEAPPDPEDTAREGAPTWQDDLREKVRSGEVRVNTGFPRLNAQILHALENPDLALYKIQQAAYKFSFLLVPISLPLVWLLFLWKRGLTLYDHVVFVLYGLCFASVLFVIAVLTAQSSWTNWATPWLIGVGFPVQSYFHVKGAYALGWWSALWRTLLLLLFAWIALAIFLVTIILLGLTA